MVSDSRCTVWFTFNRAGRMLDWEKGGKWAGEQGEMKMKILQHINIFAFKDHLWCQTIYVGFLLNIGLQSLSKQPEVFEDFHDGPVRPGLLHLLLFSTQQSLLVPETSYSKPITLNTLVCSSLRVRVLSLPIPTTNKAMPSSKGTCSKVLMISKPPKYL